MNMVAKNPETATVPAMSEAGAVLSMVAKAASDPNVDIDKLERLMQMRERALEREAKAEFSSALTDLQAELPSITERGKVEGRYTFALWEDINTIIKPVMQKHGFSLSFRTDTSNGIKVTGVLSHRNGHSEETTVTLPADPSGGKNAVQAVQSSVSYGKRSTATSLLNLTSYGEDDDGFNGGGGYDITAWRDAIKSAADMVELNRIATELKGAQGIPPKSMKDIRALWSARTKELKS